MKHGEEHDEDDEGLHDALSQIPDRFILAEEELDGAVHAEFSRYVQHLMSCQPHEAGPEVHQTLFDPTASIEVKREMLVRLARRGTVDAYRVIEQYVKNPDPVLAPWSKIALYECRMALEGELREEPVGTHLNRAWRSRASPAVSCGRWPLVRAIARRAATPSGVGMAHDMRAVRFRPGTSALSLRPRHHHAPGFHGDGRRNSR